MKSRRSVWTAFVVWCLVSLVGLGGISTLVLVLESREVRSAARQDHQDNLRLALWRMDSWLAPHLAHEAARSYVDYEPFYPQQVAYNRLLSQLGPGEVLTPSPLLNYRSEYVTLHFQMGSDGTLSSPQAPRGNLRDLAEANFLPTEALLANTVVLDALEQVIEPQTVMACASQAAVREEPVIPLPLAAERAAADDEITEAAERKQQMLKATEWSHRKGTFDPNLKAPAGQAYSLTPDNAAGSIARIGPFVPLWTTVDGVSGLVFVREVSIGDEMSYQGFVANWDALREALLAQIADLLPDAELVVVRDDAADVGSILASIPVALDVETPPPPAVPLLTPVRVTLGATWIAGFIGLMALGGTVRASLRFGEKGRRFASAVTHELRTPLTTFRMYTEMLADGMVDDDARRREYLETLRGESGRLSSLVENVLSYARLEEGGRAPTPVAVTEEMILGRIDPMLRRRTDEAGMVLDLDVDLGGRNARFDLDAVSQILFNLVDNACKYADGDDPTILVSVRRQGDRVLITVRDHGPGIPACDLDSIFDAFERGVARDSQLPGIGLGLALSRELATAMNGHLRLVPPAGVGACFELAIPVTVAEVRSGGSMN